MNFANMSDILALFQKSGISSSKKEELYDFLQDENIFTSQDLSEYFGNSSVFSTKQGDYNVTNSKDDEEIEKLIEKFLNDENFLESLESSNIDTSSNYNFSQKASSKKSRYTPVEIPNISSDSSQNSNSSSNSGSVSRRRSSGKSYQRVDLPQIGVNNSPSLNSLTSSSANSSINSSDSSSRRKRSSGIQYQNVELNLQQAPASSSLASNATSNPPSFSTNTNYSSSTPKYNALENSLEEFLLAEGYDIEAGNKLAQNALNVIGGTGYCLRGVNNTLNNTYGCSLQGYPAACDTISALQGKVSGYEEIASQFKEVVVSKDEISNLPAGTIIVWNSDYDNPYGHISICLGDGRESSDHIANQYKNISNEFHVFIPV